MTHVLVDTNVILDVFMSREPWVESSGAVLRLVETGAIEGSVAAHSVTTLHYLLARDLSRSRVRKALADLLQLVQIVPVDEDRLRHALALDWPDFEDAVQAACAESAGAAYLVTRDKKDFRRSSVKALTPAELVALVS